MRIVGEKKTWSHYTLLPSNPISLLSLILPDGQNLYQKENRLHFRIFMLTFLFGDLLFYEQLIALGGVILLC